MFKKGDKLKCVDATRRMCATEPDLTVNKEYMASKDQETGSRMVYIIDDIGRIFGYIAKRFVLSESPVGLIIVTPADRTVNILGNTLSFGAIEALYNEIKKHK